MEKLNDKKFYNFIGLFLASGWLIISMTGMFLFIIGNIYIKSILIIALIFQYFFAKKNLLIEKLFVALKPHNYIKSMKIIYEGEKPKNIKSMYCFHPHGFLCLSGIFAHSIDEEIRKYPILASRGALLCPFGGIFLTLYGLLPVDPKNIKKLMNNNQVNFFLNIFNSLI